MTRWEDESNVRCGMGPCAHGVKSSVVEWVKKITLRCFGYIEWKKSEVCEESVYK